MQSTPGSLLRRSNFHEYRKSGFIELLFDLAFAFAVTQLSLSLLEKFSLSAIAETALLTLAVWGAWIHTTWVTSRFDPRTAPLRLLLLVLAPAGLLMAIALPRAFGADALLFAGSYSFMQIGRGLFMYLAMKRESPEDYRRFQRIGAWLVLSALFWILGAFAEETWRYPLWGLALLSEYLAPLPGARTPDPGHATKKQPDIRAERLARRCGLFIVMVLGAALLVTGNTFAGLPHGPYFIAALLISCVGIVALWWTYSSVAADRPAERIAGARDPEHTWRLGYSYLHILIVAGLIVTAVSDQMLLRHPGGNTDGPTAVTLTFGPLLFLLGNLLFRAAVFHHWALSHLCGILVLLVLLPTFLFLQPVELAAGVTAVLALVGVWEGLSSKAGK